MKTANLSVIIDWLEFTVLDSQMPDIMRIMNLKWDDFSPLSKGRFGYHNQVKWNDGNIFIMFTSINDKEDADVKVNLKSGVHVMITGQGCRQYSMNHDLVNLIKRLHTSKKINFSRIDLAIDDYESEIINYDRIHEAAIKGNFTSRWSKWDEVNSRQTSTNEFLGRTMYFGSQASDIFCRIYDKTLERKANSDTENNIPHAWTRLELVYRKDRAKMLSEFIVKKDMPLGHVLRGTLNQYLRFLIPNSKDSNKARWLTTSWWDILLSNVDKLQLTIKKEAKTIEDMTDWVDQQIAPTIAAIIKAHGGDLAWLRSILVTGSKRLSQRHKDAIAQYINKEGLTIT